MDASARARAEAALRGLGVHQGIHSIHMRATSVVPGFRLVSPLPVEDCAASLKVSFTWHPPREMEVSRAEPGDLEVTCTLRGFLAQGGGGSFGPAGGGSFATGEFAAPAGSSVFSGRDLLGAPWTALFAPSQWVHVPSGLTFSRLIVPGIAHRVAARWRAP